MEDAEDAEEDNVATAGEVSVDLVAGAPTAVRLTQASSRLLANAGQVWHAPSSHSPT